MIDWLGWATFGLGATIILSSILLVAQLVGWTRMDIPMMLGTMFVEEPDKARIVGLFFHVLNGQAFALIYAAAFAATGLPTWWFGAAIGLVHGFAVMAVLVPILPGLHPRMASSSSGPGERNVLEPPGLFGLNYGKETPIISIVAHVVYGAVLGVFLT